MTNTIIKRDLCPDEFSTSLNNYHLTPVYCGVVASYDVTTVKRNDGYHRLAYLAQGEVSYNINDKYYHVDKNCAIYLPPNCCLEFHNTEDLETNGPCNLYYITFSIENSEKGEEFQQIMSNIFPEYVLHDRYGILSTLFTSLYNEATDHHLGYTGMVNWLFHIIITNMFRLSENNNYEQIIKTLPSKKKSPIIIKATNYIHSNVKSNIKINELAKELEISEIYLYKLFKEHLGKSPQQFLNDYRIQMAKEYLVSSYYSIKSISDELGYSSSNHFSKAFKNATGLSPNQWRSQTRKKQ